MSKVIITKTVYTGNINGKNNDDSYKTIGYMQIQENNKTKPEAPDFYGMLNINNIGTFNVSLWKKEKTTIAKCSESGDKK